MYQDGRAWFSRCPKELCASPTILVQVDGLKLHLSLWSIPYRDALVFQRYERIVINVWPGPTRLWAVAWFRSQTKPDRGRLYVRHVCGARV